MCIMEQYIIKGGNPLVGEVVIGGAKNAALPVLAAAVMTDGKCMIDNMPDVRDINVMLEAIQEIGARVDRIDRHTVKINGSGIKEVSVDDDISAVSAHLIILSAPCWENIRALRYRFQADATLEADPSTIILKVSARWERMYRLNAAQ